VKQNLSSAKLSTRLVAFLIALAFCSSGCATLPQRTLPEAQASRELATTESNPRININVATADELEKLPGVGKVTAERIVAHRSQYGPFRRPEHVMMVQGISDAKFRKIRGMIVVL